MRNKKKNIIVQIITCTSIFFYFLFVCGYLLKLKNRHCAHQTCTLTVSSYYSEYFVSKYNNLQ
jgi:hypothetical protein